MDASVAIYQALSDHRTQLWQTCLYLTQSPARADDLMQETLLRALTHPPKRLDCSLGPWLRRIARNLAIDWFRRPRLVQVSDLPQVASPDVAPETEVAVAHESAHAVIAAIDTLSPTQRSVLILRELLEFSVKETADALGLSEGNVKVTLHRARRALATWREEAHDADEERAALQRFARSLAEKKIHHLTDLVALGTLTGTMQGRSRDHPAVDAAGGTSSWAAILDGVAEAAAGDPEILIPVLWARAGARLAMSRVEEAQADVKRARALAESHDRRDLSTLLLLRESKISLLRGDPAGMARLDELVSSAEEPTPEDAVDIDVRVAGGLWRRGRFDDARQIFERILEGFEDPDVRSAMNLNAAFVDALRGELEEAEQRCVDAIRHIEEEGPRKWLGAAFHSLGMVLQNAGRLEEAEKWFERAVEQNREFGHRAGVGQALNNVGLLRHEQGRFGEAKTVFLRAIDVHEEVGVARSLAISWANLGVARHAAGERDAAIQALDRALGIIEGAGFRDLEAFIHAHLAAARADCDPAAAAHHLQGARRCLEGVQTTRIPDVVDALEGVVEVACAREAAARGDFLAAARWVSSAQERLELLTLPGPPDEVHPAGAPPATASFAATRIAVALLRRVLQQLNAPGTPRCASPPGDPAPRAG